MSYARSYQRAGLRTLSGLGATDVSTPFPAPGSNQPPIWPLVVGNNGAYLAVRSSSAQGACGTHGYPCQHPGTDVNGAQGTLVHAPESGTIIGAGDGNSAPFVGYGPWYAVVQGDGGKFHLLGHLDPSTAGMGLVGTRVTAGQVVGTTSSANHTHWEVRSKAVPDFAAGETNFTNNVDPVDWLSRSSSPFIALLLLGGAALFAALLWRN